MAALTRKWRNDDSGLEVVDDSDRSVGLLPEAFIWQIADYIGLLMWMNMSGLISVLKFRVEWGIVANIQSEARRPMETPTISTIFGTAGAVCWSVQLIPQIYLNYRRHSAVGLSAPFMMLWACAGIPLGVYNIVANHGIALMVQPQILTSLSLITLGQCFYYERKWRFLHVSMFILVTGHVMGGIQIGLIFAVRYGLKQSEQWPMILMAVLAAILLALGVFEQYIAIWKSKSVNGISFLFCGIDALGDLTSIVAVVFRGRKLDVLGLVAYAVEFVLWAGIFACGLRFRVMPWVTRRFKTLVVCQSANEGSLEGTISRDVPDMPASASVFRTPLEETEMRRRLGHSRISLSLNCV